MALPPAPQRTTAAFGFSNLERALYDCVAKRHFGKAEMEAVLAFFGDEPPRCVFCGSTKVQRWDHLVAVMQGGETVLGNMVPACQRCDDSKQHQPYATWMRSTAPQSPTSRGISDVEARIARIDASVAYFGYVVRPLEDRLDAEEHVMLAAVRTQLAEARATMVKLVAHHATRCASAGPEEEVVSSLAEAPEDSVYPSSQLTVADWNRFLATLRLRRMTDPDPLFRCVRAAYRSLNRTIHGVRQMPKARRGARAVLSDRLAALRDSHMVFADQDAFDAWHEATCVALSTAFADQGYAAFSVGQAQKWL